MSTFLERDHSYSKPPIYASDNRDEHFLIEVAGAWIPECEIIFYGLLNSPLSEEFYKLRELTTIAPKSIYLDTCFLSAEGLIRWLASPDNELVDLDADFIIHALATAYKYYDYIPSSETMIRHALIELMYQPFVKSVTLVYPWEFNDRDSIVLKSILPSELSEKVSVVTGSLLDCSRNTTPDNGEYYTTVIMNSAEDLIMMLDSPGDYSIGDTFFLLRNNSDNVVMIVDDDPNDPGKKTMKFEEVYNKEIMSYLVTSGGIPKSGKRFARYEPYLFEDRPQQDDFFGNLLFRGELE